MKRILLAACFVIALLVPASQAQFNGCQAGFCGGKPLAVTYTGPGDVVSGAKAWYGLRAYNAAYSGNVVDVCDVATGSTCGTATALNGVITFPLIGGLSCNGGVACNISKFYDQTLGNNCGSATCDVSQATNGNRAALSFSCAGLTSGLPCAVFNGSSDGYASANSLSTLSQPVTEAAVCERTAAFTSQGYCFSTGSNSTLLGFSTSTNTAVIYAGTNLTAAAADSVAHSIQGIYNGNGTSSTISVDGSSTMGAANTNTPTGIIRIGTTSGNLRLNGIWTESGLWSGAFSAGNLSAMNSNQHTYWGF